MVKSPVKGVQIKGGRYYRVIHVPPAEKGGSPTKRWTPLTTVRDGLPMLYRALAELETHAVADDSMPGLIADWQRDVMSRHSAKTQASEVGRCRVLAEAFADFRAGQVQAPDVAEFLRPWQDRARSHNLYRALLRELMRYAIERGYRTVNPVTAIRTMTEVARTRSLTDSETRRIKVGALYGDDGRRNRSGIATAAAIELAVLTAADVSVLLDLRIRRDPANPGAPHVCADGLMLRRTKTTTSRPVLIEWTPRLRAVVKRLQGMKRGLHACLFESVDRTPLTYEALAAAWQRAVRRSGVAPCMFRDLRAKAATDKAAAEGIEAAREMLDHTTQGQTADYIRRRSTVRTKATK